MAAPVKITEAHWTLILSRIRASQCVPFLGAGVNAGSNGLAGLPSGARVALSLIEDLTGKHVEDLKDLVTVTTDDSLAEFRDLARVGFENLARVSLHHQQALDQMHLMGRLREVIADEQHEPPRLLEVLAGLPLRLVVTSNYDRLMERALEAAGTEFVAVHQPTAGYDDRRQKELQAALAEWRPKLMLYKIHGTFLDADADGEAAMRCRPIITEDDYIEFLTVAAIEGRGVPNLIGMEFVTSTLLFLGYSLEDWDFRTIFKGLIEKLPPHQQRKSFALQKDPDAFWTDLWHKKGVVIYNVDVNEFANELAERLDG